MRAVSFQTITSDRETLATPIGCQFRFRTSVGRLSTAAAIGVRSGVVGAACYYDKGCRGVYVALLRRRQGVDDNRGTQGPAPPGDRRAGRRGCTSSEQSTQASPGFAGPVGSGSAA